MYNFLILCSPATHCKSIHIYNTLYIFFYIKTEKISPLMATMQTENNHTSFDNINQLPIIEMFKFLLISPFTGTRNNDVHLYGVFSGKVRLSFNMINSTGWEQLIFLITMIHGIKCITNEFHFFIQTPVLMGVKIKNQQ